MNNSVTQKALQKPDFTLYPKLFSVIKNVENAVRLLVYDHMKLLQSGNCFFQSSSLFSIRPLKSLLVDNSPKSNLEFYMAVSNHLNQYERSIKSLLKEEVLEEAIKEIYFLIHQAYIELDKADIQTILDQTKPIEEFEDYLQSRIS